MIVRKAFEIYTILLQIFFAYCSESVFGSQIVEVWRYWKVSSYLKILLMATDSISYCFYNRVLLWMYTKQQNCMQCTNCWVVIMLKNCSYACIFKTQTAFFMCECEEKTYFIFHRILVQKLDIVTICHKTNLVSR